MTCALETAEQTCVFKSNFYYNAHNIYLSIALEFEMVQILALPIFHMLTKFYAIEYH